ncbi:lipopolysaccharide export system protein LptC [Roseinatronobacter thiooxidans]|uniref:Lipopolysaccharide export system protein LptC n=2 Tax=Roseinatronobacter thiooxidans TaxID=121821 RepID=A0A2W7QFE0_9RHOB|nr:lipopolysaccharide export system protein LptC [Roseinatronobacter thiooxidans]
MAMRRPLGPFGLHLARILRLALPLGALALLSTVFLLSRGVDPQRAVEMSDIDVEELTREPRVGGARFAGVTQDDTALTISARSVRSTGDLRESGPLLLRLDMPQGELQFPSGRVALFQAQEGRIDQSEDEILLRGDVVLETSDGYRMTMPELISAIQTTHMRGLGGISGDAPAGEISADSVELRHSAQADGGYLLAFKGNVRLIYRPDE